jgi:leucyl aminopeptidase (aminopeptidase T)
MPFNAVEMKNAVDVSTKELLQLKQGERLLIYVDQESDYSLAEMLQEAARSMGVETEIFEITSGLKLGDAAEELARKIQEVSFDVICELSGQYYYQTPAWQKALQTGSRLYSLGGLDRAAFVRCIGEVDHGLMFQFGMALRSVLQKTRSVQVTTQAGTDLRFRLNSSLISRAVSRLTGSAGSRVFRPTGLLTQDRRWTFLGGQLSLVGIPGSMEGTAVIDGYMWPPNGIGRLDDAPIVLKIKKGHVADIAGSSAKSKLLTDWFGQQPKEIQHFCIGFHPGATFSGKLLEAERVWGAVNIGIGVCPLHIDGVIKRPSIFIDDEQMEREGSFTHGNLAPLEKRLIDFR